MNRHKRLSAVFAALTCACCVSGARADYKAKAVEVTDYIQRNFFDEGAGLYRPVTPVQTSGLPFDVMWANGVQFSVLAGAVRLEPRYRPALDGFAKGLERYWDKDAPVPGFDAYFSSRDGDDKYYDDNAWLVLGFAEAFRNTHDPVYLEKARQTQKFVLSGWDEKLGGGIYWQQNKLESKNTCINAPAAVAALELYGLTHDASDLEWAKRLVTWTRANLQDTDGLYWDNINLNGKVERTKWTYNTALMIRANIGLWRVTHDASFLREARREADASLKQWIDPATGAFADGPRFNHLLAESLLRAYKATNDAKYLNAVRRNADFGYRYVRDAQHGGYWDAWEVRSHAADERKTLIENAAMARELWLLAPYPDVEQLRASAEAAAQKGDTKTALTLLRQALDSTAGAPAPKN